MTRLARVVLQDAKYAISMHSDMLQSEGFRASWFSVVALLRAVGHVLDKVDSELSPTMKRAIQENWKILLSTKPEPTIFWGFIEHERNRFLKNYEHGIVRTLTSTTPSVGGRTYRATSDLANSRGGRCESPGATFKSYIADGPYAGRPERAVALEAHTWWKKYLDDVDALSRSYEVDAD